MSGWSWSTVTDDDGRQTLDLSELERATGDELEHAGYPRTLEDLADCGALEPLHPTNAKYPVWTRDPAEGLPENVRLLIVVLKNSAAVQDAFAREWSPAAAAHAAITLGYFLHASGIEPLRPLIATGRKVREASEAGREALQNGNGDKWATWQATLDALHRKHPDWSYNRLREATAKKHHVSERIIKMRCRNPKK